MGTDERVGIRHRIYQCTVDGVEMGVTSLSRLTGLSTDTIYHRLYRGETLQEVADSPRKYAYYEFEGTAYTMKELCCMAGMPRRTVRNHLQKGDSVKSIIMLGRERMQTPDSRYSYKGQKYSIRKLATLPECRVCLGTLRKRLKEYGWSVEEALNTPAYGRYEEGGEA